MKRNEASRVAWVAAQWNVPLPFRVYVDEARRVGRAAKRVLEWYVRTPSEYTVTRRIEKIRPFIGEEMKFSPSIGSHSRCPIVQEYLGSWDVIAAENNVAALERAFFSAWQLLASMRSCLAVEPEKAPTCPASCSGTLPCVCTPICTIVWWPRACLCGYEQLLTLGDRHEGALLALCSNAPSPLPAPSSNMAKHRCPSSLHSLCVSYF